MLEHTSLPVRFPQWFEAVVMTPATRRRDGGAVNLGSVLTIRDRLAGTWIPIRTPALTAYGPATPSPANRSPLSSPAGGTSDKP